MAKNLIGTNWCDASDGRTINIMNPATNELIDTVPESSKLDCDKAVEAAHVAQKEWTKKPIHERASILMKFVSIVESHKDELAKLLSDETGKPISEAIGEIANVSIGVPAFCEKAKHEYGKVLSVGKKSLEASRTLTALRAMAMVKSGTMGDRLFDYPQYYGSEGLFFADDSLETLRYTNDSIYYLLGARPYRGEQRMVFLRNICYKGTGKYTSLDYYLSALLLDKNLNEFAEAVNDFYEPEDTLPRFYREAMVLYWSQHADSVSLKKDTAYVRRFAEYREKEKEYASAKERENWMRRYYGDTYWWYFDYQN